MREIPREDYVADCEGKVPRSQFEKLMQFMEGGRSHRVMLLYGLRRTGKTTLMEQVLAQFPEEKCVFLEAEDGDTFDDVEDMLEDARVARKKYVVIDEITRAEHFINQCAILSDLYAKADMKIILSGTDSLGLLFARNDELFDRDRMVHTTHIPFAEHARVLGTRDIDDYIRFGGLMQRGMDEDGVYDLQSAKKYLDSAVSDNIANSLKKDRHETNMLKKFPKKELRCVVEKLVERYSGTMEREDVVDALSSVTPNWAIGRVYKAKEPPVKFPKTEKMFVTEEFIKLIHADTDIMTEVTDRTVSELKSYLNSMRVLSVTETRMMDKVNGKWQENEPKEEIYIVQPAIKYFHLKAAEKYITEQKTLPALSKDERAVAVKLLDNKICGDMLDQIVPFDVKAALSTVKYGNEVRIRDRSVKYDVEKIKFHYDEVKAGEYDLLIYDYENKTHWAFEVKHTPNPYQGYNDDGEYNGQDRHLLNPDFTEFMGWKYGKRAGYAVLYTGDPFLASNGTPYLNVADFLISIEDTKDITKTMEELTKDLPERDVMEKPEEENKDCDGLTDDTSDYG